MMVKARDATTLYAAEPAKTAGVTGGHGWRAITVAQGLTETPLEASGLWYHNGKKIFYMISDETDRKQAVIFIMDTSASVFERLPVTGISEVNDLEGITCGPGGHYYLLTSQSYNKKGNLPKSRTLLLELEGTAKGLNVLHSVPLYELLCSAADQETQSSWGQFITAGKRGKSIDIEGIAFTGDTLLLGFKNPKKDNKAVILGISSSGKMFQDGVLLAEQLFIWNMLPLYDSVSGTFCGISDLYMHTGGVLAGVATGVVRSYGLAEDVGLVWRYDTRSGTMEIMRRFAGVKPEGITYNQTNGEYSIVFDNGSKSPSYYMKLKAPL